MFNDHTHTHKVISMVDLLCSEIWTRECMANWMMVTSVDNGWPHFTSPVAACRAPSNNAGCYSAQFSTQQVPYNRVCGMVIGYQKGKTDGLWTTAYSIDEPYVLL